MSSHPARLSSRARPSAEPDETPSADRRRGGRITRFDSHTQPVGQLTLIDVSSFGCCVRHADRLFGPGHFIALNFATIGTITGYVRWRDEENMGVEFCRAIPPATERALATHEVLESVRRL